MTGSLRPRVGRHRHGRRPGDKEAETGVMQPQAQDPQDHRCHRKPERKERLPLSASGGCSAETAGSQPSGLNHHGGINLCCFKWPRLWSFVTAAPGHSHSNLHAALPREGKHSAKALPRHPTGTWGSQGTAYLLGIS